MSEIDDFDAVGAQRAAQLNEANDPYELQIITPSFPRRILMIVMRAFSTNVRDQITFEDEAAKLKPYGYGGLAVRYLCWRESVMMMGALFLCYSLGDDAYTKVADIVKKEHHAGAHDLYRKIFHTQILIGDISDGVYALSLLVALCFWLYALYSWKNFKKSKKALRIGYIISFVIPFVLMLTFPYRKGLDVEMLAQESCHSVINGRIPDILSQMKHSGDHASPHGAKKAALKKNKPQIKNKFATLLASHIPKVNLTSMFHRMHIEVPDTICEFSNPHWSANIKQRLINAGFVRDQVTGTCPVAVKALKVMHVLPKGYKTATPQFRHLLEATSTESDDAEVFSFDSNKKFTKAQCKPCESCVDPQCRAHSAHVLGKSFSLSPILKKSLHAVTAAKAYMHDFKKKHEAARHAAKDNYKHKLKKLGHFFEKELQAKVPNFRKAVEEGKKALKNANFRGILHLKNFDKKVKNEYKKLRKEEHEVLEKIQKAGALRIHRARMHGQHAWKEAKKKFAKRFKKSKELMEQKLKNSHKKMTWDIRRAKAAFLAKKVSLTQKLAAVRHARYLSAHGGLKTMLKFKARLFAKVNALEKKFKAKFASKRASIMAKLAAKRAKFAARLSKTHSSKKYVLKLKEYMAKIDKEKKKAVLKILNAEHKMMARMKHAKASSFFYASKKDIAGLLHHIKMHARANLKHVNKDILHKMLSFAHSGAHHLKTFMGAAKTAFRKEYAAHLATYNKFKAAAFATFQKTKIGQSKLLNEFKAELKKGLAQAKAAGPAIFKKAEAEAKQRLLTMKKEVKAMNSKARDHMRTMIDHHHKIFAAAIKVAKGKVHALKAKIHAKYHFMQMLAKHTAAFKKKYEANKAKYKHAYRAAKAKLHAHIAQVKKSLAHNKLKLAAELKKIHNELKLAKVAMKIKIAKGKLFYKAHKAQLKHEIHTVAHKARVLTKAAGVKVHKIASKVQAKVHTLKAKVNAHAHRVTAAAAPVLGPKHAPVLGPKNGRRLLNDDHDLFAANEVESAEDSRHAAHHEAPAKCASCHAACYKNCAAQYFGPKILENTVNGYMCMSSQHLNAIDTIKTAMDAVSHVDYLLGSQEGLQAFGILLPASLSFLSAVLKASKLTKKVLPQSRLSGYLIVLAALSNIPIMAAFIAMAYQAVGDVYFCLGCLSFLCTFFIFCTRTESLVKSMTHEEANETIDRRGKYTFIAFGGAGLFLGIFLYEHQSVVRAALHLPLTMLIIKKVCDFLGRTMFTFVVLVDLVFSLFDKLYDDNTGDKLSTQEFAVPLSQIKRLFEDRDAQIARIEAQ